MLLTYELSLGLSEIARKYHSVRAQEILFHLRRDTLGSQIHHLDASRHGKLLWKDLFCETNYTSDTSASHLKTWQDVFKKSVGIFLIRLNVYDSKKRRDVVLTYLRTYLYLFIIMLKSREKGKNEYSAQKTIFEILHIINLLLQGFLGGGGFRGGSFSWWSFGCGSFSRDLAPENFHQIFKHFCAYPISRQFYAHPINEHHCAHPIYKTLCTSNI